jgi:uncharacterized OB-fold protein
MTEIAPLIAGNPDAPFWEAWAKDERFLLHRCSVCGRTEWPATCCLTHGMAPMRWVESEGAGTVDTFTIFRRAYTAELAVDVPYAVIVVRLDEGPYFHSRLVEGDLDTLTTGQRVRLRRGAGDAFPLFVPE